MNVLKRNNKQSKSPNFCRCLDIESISKTIQKLEQRVVERFPEAGLRKITHELLTISEEVKQRSEQISRPIWKVRLPIGISIVFVIAMLGVFFSYLPAFNTTLSESASDLLQGFDSSLNGLFLVIMLIFFLFTLENRLKRNKIIKALQELRAIAHVVDMHQLTKDPTYMLNPKAIMTASSPARSYSKFELIRYLDYCAELLALIGKLAGYYAQRHNDPVVHDAVNDIEMLTNDLARKIWQKIAVISEPNKEN